MVLRIVGFGVVTFFSSVAWWFPGLVVAVIVTGVVWPRRRSGVEEGSMVFAVRVVVFGRHVFVFLLWAKSVRGGVGLGVLLAILGNKLVLHGFRERADGVARLGFGRHGADGHAGGTRVDDAFAA